MSKQNKISNSKRRERLDSLFARKGVSIVLILAVLILVVSVISLSFSWFEPESISGRGAEYNATISVRSENCSLTTYASSVINDQSSGKIEYSDTVPTGAVNVPASSIVYFKTEIKNNDSQNPTNVSLYISQIPNESSNVSIGLGVATPTNNYHEYTSQQPGSGDPGVYIVRNLYVDVANTELDVSGITTVEWFVKNNSTESTVHIDVSKLFLMYN